MYVELAVDVICKYGLFKLHSFLHHCLLYKYRDEETGLFSAPSESMVQQLWMDVQQFEEASDKPHAIVVTVILACTTYRYSVKKQNILLEKFY